MIDANKDYGKLHLILDLVERNDIRHELDEKFTKDEQNKIFEMFKGIVADEIHFVMNVLGNEKQQITKTNNPGTKH